MDKQVTKLADYVKAVSDIFIFLSNKKFNFEVRSFACFKDFAKFLKFSWFLTCFVYFFSSTYHILVFLSFKRYVRWNEKFYCLIEMFLGVCRILLLTFMVSKLCFVDVSCAMFEYNFLYSLLFWTNSSLALCKVSSVLLSSCGFGVL